MGQLPGGSKPHRNGLLQKWAVEPLTYEAVLFIATAQWACNGSVPPRLTPPLDPARVANRKGSYLLKTVTPRFTAERNPQTLFMTYAKISSDYAGHERLQRLVAHLVGVAAGISAGSAEVDCALYGGARMFGAADQPRLAGLVGDNEAEGNRGRWQHIGATEAQGGGVGRMTRLLFGDALTLRLTIESHRGNVGEDGHGHLADAVQVNAAR